MPTNPPPIAPRIPHPVTLHGDTWDDPYHWLRERENPATLAYLAAENAYYEQELQPLRPLADELYAELCARISPSDASVPVQQGEYLYYTRIEPGQQYPLHCRRRGPEAPEELLLDQNALAAGQSYFQLGYFKVSPDHRLLAYTTDTAGNEVYTLFFKNLETGELLPERIPNVYYGAEWAADSRTLLYNVLDAALRPFQAWLHRVGDAPAQDALVYHEADESYYLDVAKTRSQAYLLINLTSTNTSEVRFAPASQPGAFAVVAPRRHGHEYSVAHHGERLLIVTNHEAINFKLVEAPVSAPGQAGWRELIAHRADTLIDGVDLFRDFLVVYERTGGLKHIRIAQPDGGEPRYVAFPEPVYDFTPGPNEEFASRTLRFSYSSLVTPESVIDYDLATGDWALRKQEQIPSGYDPALYQCERLHARAADGALVPISLVYRKDRPADGRGPLLLYGYGAYGATVDPAFAQQRLSLLDRGVAFAIGHIRGGADLGRAWYEQGKLLHKRNSFTDLIACAEQLIAAGHCAPDRLAIMGGSAGGLLVSAAATMRPDLFRAVIAHVPFVDVINTMCDPSIPLVVNEYEQWGDPADPAQYAYMRTYSPYDNVAAVAYPHLLVTAGLNDPRVAYWEPAKWVAALRATKTDGNLLLLKTNMSTGHFGASGRYAALREVAEEYAFLLHTLGAA